MTPLPSAPPADAFTAVGQALETAPWTFAKTMPQNPHEYTLRRRWDDDAFCKAVAYIRVYGYRHVFQRRPYLQLDVNGHTYWTMGAPLPATILINRKVRATAAPYDAIAPVYDGLFHEPADAALDTVVLCALGDLAGLRVLDVGCGTGWLLDSGRVGPYCGIDASRGMLDRLHAKHLGLNGRVIHTPLADFVGGPFDRVLALFGTASYLTDAEVARIPRLLAPGGRYWLMAYAPDYTPVTYVRSGITVPRRTTPLPLPGPPRPLGPYLVWEGGR